MNDIYIIDYIGNSDSKGNPIGHPTKVINEYSELIENTYNINLIVPENYKEVIKHNNINSVRYLNYYMNMTANSLFEKLQNLCGRISNLTNILKNKNQCILWFSNVDFLLFALLSLYTPKKGQKIIATVFLQQYSNENVMKSKLKNYFIKKGISKINCIISSNENLNFHCKNIFIPDYFYNPEFYDKYKAVKKKTQVLCIGTMTKSKDIEGLVETFLKIDIPVKIIGKFIDKSLYNNLKSKIKTNYNISVEDKYLDNDEYYSLIAESKYIILPYKQSYYNKRTSGVLLEAMFLDTIPIAPDYLLKFNDIKGIGYTDINEVKNLLNVCDDNVILENFVIKKSEYNISSIKSKLINMLMNEL